MDYFCLFSLLNAYFRCCLYHIFTCLFSIFWFFTFIFQWFRTCCFWNLEKAFMILSMHVFLYRLSFSYRSFTSFFICDVKSSFWSFHSCSLACTFLVTSSLTSSKTSSWILCTTDCLICMETCTPTQDVSITGCYSPLSCAVGALFIEFLRAFGSKLESSEVLWMVIGN